MRRPVLSVLTLLALAAAAPRAGAQFSAFTWTLFKPNGGFATVGPTGMGFSGFIDSTPGSLVKYTTGTHMAGRVGVQAHVMPEDGVCSGGGSLAQYFVGGSPTTFANCTFFGEVSFDVADGQTFGFGLQTFNISWPYSVNLTDFTFTPYWTVLGGALAGGGGAPVLVGMGILQPGQPMSLQLNNAAPSAPLAIVMGLNQLNAPFKGGVLVPTMDLLLAGLTTSGLGTFSLPALFPASVPVNTSFIVQAWVKDASGPAGFTASNSMRGTRL